MAKASRYMYSTPKYKARGVKNRTSREVDVAKRSPQKARWESIIFKHVNHVPMSIYRNLPRNNCAIMLYTRVILRATKTTIDT